MARRIGRKFLIVLLLAWVGGFVDAVGFMTLYKLFTAHMSGNSVEFGVAIGTGVWATVLQKGVPIAAFVIGVGIGTITNELSHRRKVRSTVAGPLAIEAALLAAYLAWSDTHLSPKGTVGSPTQAGYYVAALLLVVAMGIQSSTLRRAGGERVQTTYVTEILTKLAEVLVAWAFWVMDRRSAPESGSDTGERRRLRREVVVLGGVWLVYSVGGICGAVTHLHIARWAPVPPLVVITGLFLFELWNPHHERDLAASGVG